MKKIVLQASFSISLFFALWWMLSQFNFTKNKHISKLDKFNDSIIGDILMKQFEISSEKIENDSINNIINGIKEILCSKNKINSNEINIHIFKNSEINAYTFPGKNIVIHSELIEYCDNAEELSSVMAHEIAHIELNHITKKLVKEIGVSMLMIITGNNASPEILMEIIHQLSSTSFDREMEISADTKAVEYLINSKIDPRYFANFLYRLSEKENSILPDLKWFNTHPNSDQRAADILTLKSDHTFDTLSIISDEKWEFLLTNIK